MLRPRCSFAGRFSGLDRIGKGGTLVGRMSVGGEVESVLNVLDAIVSIESA